MCLFSLPRGPSAARARNFHCLSEGPRGKSTIQGVCAGAEPQGQKGFDSTVRRDPERRPTIARRLIRLSEKEQAIVQRTRQEHADWRVRQKMNVLWVLHLGYTRKEAAEIVGRSRGAVQRYVAEYRKGGLEALARRAGRVGPVCDLEAHRDELRQSFRDQPVRSVAEAADRIERLTGVRRGPTQVRMFLKRCGLSWQRLAAIPVPPKRSVEEHVAEQERFHDEKLKPALEAALAGQGHVFFVDAAHFVFGTFLCCLWSFTRLFVRAASGRQRLNVLGAWNAVTRELIAVTNTTVVNTKTMCELLRTIAAQGLAGPVTVVLDNARYQRNAVVQALAAQLKITLLYLPSYSPNLNLIERLWRFIRHEALYGRYHATFRDFQTAIHTCLAELHTRHTPALEKRMTLNFQTFENVSLLAA
ncbi:MAG: IS630 family transposase [Acidobacteria bacterium]|nr:IS630 family transposase [Acidobacteriota bacterium]